MSEFLKFNLRYTFAGSPLGILVLGCSNTVKVFRLLSDGLN